MFCYIRAAAFAYVGQQYFSGDNPFDSWKQSAVLATAAVDPEKSIEIQGALRTLAGGTASRLGGGKFASGATSAAMGFFV